MIDESVIDLMLWVEERGNARKIGKAEGRQPGKGETWVPAYGSLRDILAEYGGRPDAPEAQIPDAEIDALIADLEQDAPVAF